MKKLFLTLLTATSLFATSCSSDSDPVIDNPTKEGKLIDVNLNVKSAAYEIDKTPLAIKAIGDNETMIRVVAYKKTTGEVYADTTLYSAKYASLLKQDGTLPLSIKLREGDYHVAIIHNRTKTSADQIHPIEAWDAKNFNTDVILHGRANVHYTAPGDANQEVYYNTADISVAEANTNTLSIALEPMWSSATITFTDPKTFLAPTNAKYLYIDVTPVTWDLNVKTKLAVTQAAPATHNINAGGYLFDISWLRSQDSFAYKFNISKTDTVNNNMKIVVKFYTEQDLTNLIQAKTINLNTQIENGQNYLISGKIGNLTGVDQSMSVTLGDFKNENIIIE